MFCKKTTTNPVKKELVDKLATKNACQPTSKNHVTCSWLTAVSPVNTDIGLILSTSVNPDFQSVAGDIPRLRIPALREALQGPRQGPQERPERRSIRCKALPAYQQRASDRRQIRLTPSTSLSPSPAPDWQCIHLSNKSEVLR